MDAAACHDARVIRPGERNSSGDSRGTKILDILASVLTLAMAETAKGEFRAASAVVSNALAADIERSYAGHLDRGGKNPTVTTLEKFAMALSCDISELFAPCPTAFQSSHLRADDVPRPEHMVVLKGYEPPTRVSFLISHEFYSRFTA